MDRIECKVSNFHKKIITTYILSRDYCRFWCFFCRFWYVSTIPALHVFLSRQSPIVPFYA